MSDNLLFLNAFDALPSHIYSKFKSVLEAEYREVLEPFIPMESTPTTLWVDLRCEYVEQMSEETLVDKPAPIQLLTVAITCVHLRMTIEKYRNALFGLKPDLRNQPTPMNRFHEELDLYIQQTRDKVDLLMRQAMTQPAGSEPLLQEWDSQSSKMLRALAEEMRRQQRWTMCVKELYAVLDDHHLTATTTRAH